MRKGYYFTFLLLLICLDKGYSDEPRRQLSLEDCIGIALDQNPAARAAQEGIVIAQESIGIARAPYYPDLRFVTSYSRWQTHLFFPPIASPIPGVTIKIPSILGPFNDYHININSRYLLYDSGLRRAQLMEAKALKGIAEEEETRIQQEIILNVALAFYGLAADQELVEVARQSLSRSEDHAKLVKDKNQVGSVPYSDLLRSQVNTANTRQALVKINSTVKIAAGNLNAAMGLPPETPLDIQSVRGEVVSPTEIDLTCALNEAVNNRSEINAALFNIAALRSQVNQNKSAYGPKILAEGSYGRCDTDFYPQDPDWSIGVTFEMPLFEGFDTRHRVRRSEAELRKALAEYDSLVVKVKQDVWNAYSNLFEAYESIQAALAQVKDAKESLRLVTERYKVGASIVTDLLDVETAYTSSQANLVDAHWRYRSAYSLFMWSQGKIIAH